ncbi:hypothetical protein [Nonlabens sp. Asnod2-A12]|uniref:hypothetical protein n=1 Tax=Nonlabens sp. Asnod2-A12 TaxID=3160578 RepID=UPI003865E680
MKTSFYVIIIFLLVLLCSCGQKEAEGRFQGTWFNLENEYDQWNFRNDTLYVYEEMVIYDATRSKIEFDIPILDYYEDSIWEFRDRSILVNYKLSESNDSIYATWKSIYNSQDFSLIKVNSYEEYLRRKFNFKFHLPENDSVKTLQTIPKYGLKIFMGKTDGTIISRTELSNNLNSMKSNIKSFKDSIRPNTHYEIEDHDEMIDEWFHIRVYADKQISDSTIIYTLQQTKTFKNQEKWKGEDIDNRVPIRIYRVFKNRNQTNPNSVKGKWIKWMFSS